MWSWIEHTGEAELAIEAATEDQVFNDALEALSDLLGDGAPGATTRFDVRASAADRPALLADWLSELLFLAETESFVPERLERLELSGTSLSATVSGHVGRPSPLVKAVTYHDLVLEPAQDGWRARVVLDV